MLCHTLRHNLLLLVSRRSSDVAGLSEKTQPIKQKCHFIGAKNIDGSLVN